MIQPSPAARTSKRTPSKPTPARPEAAKTRPDYARIDAEAARRAIEAKAVGKVIRGIAEDFTNDVDCKFRALRRFLVAADGDDQLGLHKFRSACFRLDDAIRNLRSSIMETKVRGEAGHTDE